MNLLLQRSDPIIHLMYDALFDTSVTLLSRFISPDIVTQYKNHKLSNEDIRIIVEDPDYYLPTNTLFVGFLGRTQANKLLHDRMISENEYEAFFTAGLNFHKTGFLYALKSFRLDNELLQHARIFNFLNQVPRRKTTTLRKFQTTRIPSVRGGVYIVVISYITRFH